MLPWPGPEEWSSGSRGVVCGARARSAAHREAGPALSEWCHVRSARAGHSGRRHKHGGAGGSACGPAPGGARRVCEANIHSNYGPRGVAGTLHCLQWAEGFGVYGAGAGRMVASWPRVRGFRLGIATRWWWCQDLGSGRDLVGLCAILALVGPDGDWREWAREARHGLLRRVRGPCRCGRGEVACARSRGVGSGASSDRAGGAVPGLESRWPGVRGPW